MEIFAREKSSKKRCNCVQTGCDLYTDLSLAIRVPLDPKYSSFTSVYRLGADVLVLSRTKSPNCGVAFGLLKTPGRLSYGALSKYQED
ncbi:hypothetical protein HO173_005303 [Letharia columbiana]|uniref:Uncharacterized protein n=1 Tax=Letharia columbiana TaxID=112416 RepID=A0A8H6L5M2_9LECA|nr:uncharacterized protein HO173_005303 [Letharia columbiana]KAF6236522.1 hypothetical protein HO173_005303 [Letharia columbiana]